MGARFVPISFDTFKSQMDLMGFIPVTVPGTLEYVFERVMHEDRFAVRIYSSITMGETTTRDCGADAIRVVLYDRVLDKASYSETVKRTRNALETLQGRAREAWAHKNKYKCSCGAVMAQRTGSSHTRSFMGCTAYPVCKNRMKCEG